jgi:hypothetical protein
MNLKEGAKKTLDIILDKDDNIAGKVTRYVTYALAGITLLGAATGASDLEILFRTFLTTGAAITHNGLSKKAKIYTMSLFIKPLNWSDLGNYKFKDEL